MKYIFLIIIVFYKNLTFSQGHQAFNLTPDIGAYKQNSQFRYLMLDSQYIYIVGDELKEKTPGGEIFIENHLTQFDYNGNLITSRVLKDSSLERPSLSSNTPCLKKNDSVYYCYLYTMHDTINQYSSPTLIELNILRNKITKTLVFAHPLHINNSFDCFAFNHESNTGKIILGFQVYVDNYPFIYIYELDSSLNIKKIIPLPKFMKLQIPHWIEKQPDGTYDLVCDAVEFKNNEPLGPFKLVFIKSDSLGTIIKKQELNVSQDFIFSGETYSVYRNEDKTFNISAHEYNSQLDKTAPWALHVSSGFDTVYWMKKFYEYLKIKQENPYYFINYMAYSIFDTSFITVGDINGAVINDAYGFIYKVTKNGDSLWTRKYLPTGWNDGRALWMNFYQVAISPYNTIVVCGRVSDTLDHDIKGWILQLDKDGCLVPGCGEIVRNEDIQSGKEKAFKLFPNPIHDKFCLLSRISSNDKFRLTIFNLQGQKVKETLIKPEVGAQYIFMIPDGLVSGNYILNIFDQKGKLEQEEKLIIQK